MIAALNAAGLDLATLGNHEFDFGDDVLIQRMREARFEWVVSNVIDTNTGQPIGGAAAVPREDVRRAEGRLHRAVPQHRGDHARQAETHRGSIDPLAAAGQYLPILKREGATVIVAVTHLTFATDRALVEKFPEIDLVIGGHEHFPITATENRTLISKAGSDAKALARIDVNRTAEGTVERFYELLPITGAIPDEPRTAAVIASFESRLGAELDTVVGDHARAARRHQQPPAHRGNQPGRSGRRRDARRCRHRHRHRQLGQHPRQPHLSPGPLTRRTLIEIHPFDNVIVKLSDAGTRRASGAEHAASRNCRPRPGYFRRCPD